jgi:hypothetical protein
MDSQHGGASNADLIRKIRCCPTRVTTFVNAVQALILAG